MKITENHETLVTLEEATHFLPKRTTGARISAWTLRRWAKEGLNHEQLEVVKLGRTLCTSKEAIERFVENVTEAWAMSRQSPR